MKWTWILLFAVAAYAFASTGHALPKCHNQMKCGDSCHQEGAVYKQCKPANDQQRAYEDKCGLGVPGGDQCGTVFSGTGPYNCNTNTAETCGGEYYKSGECTSA